MSASNPELVAMLDKMDEQMDDIRHSIKIIESNNRRITEDIPKTLKKMEILNKQIDEMKAHVTYNDEDQVQMRNHQHETRKRMFAKFFEELDSCLKDGLNPVLSDGTPLIFTNIKPENISVHIKCIDDALNTAREKYGDKSSSFYKTNDDYIEKLFESILKNNVLHNLNTFTNTSIYSFRRVISPQYSLDYSSVIGVWRVVPTGLH